jgi:hypothetical protein
MVGVALANGQNAFALCRVAADMAVLWACCPKMGRILDMARQTACRRCLTAIDDHLGT